MVPRKTTLITSAAPATARKNSASPKRLPERPNNVMAAPQAATAHTTASPWRRIRPTHPVVRAAITAPAAGAA